MHYSLVKLGITLALASLSQSLLAEDKPIQTDENHIEKLLITASPLGRSVLESATPVSILSGDELEMNQSATLGETLKSVPGVNSTYFGPVSSSPIIRGLDGPRVKVVQNGMDSSDASRVGPDHIASTEASTATQIEVLRGPATLLYGSGAIGGVVNVVDNRLPKTRQEGTSGRVSALHNTVSNERTVSTDLNGGQGNLAWHFDAFSRTTDDYEVPEFTLEDGDKVDSLENSMLDAKGFTLGTGWIGDNHSLSFAYGKLDSDYGIPGHSHEEEHHEEHIENQEEHDEEGVYASMQQERFQSVLDINNLSGWLTEVHWHNAYTDYQHREIEEGEVGTTFTNDTFESRLWAKHANTYGWQGVVGLHYSDSDFAAAGAEAFTPSTSTNSTALFVLEEQAIGNFLWQLGARLERVSHQPDNSFFAEQASSISFDELTYTAGSVSAGFVYELSDNQSFAVNFAHSERAPSSAEIFSNGIHISTSTYEVGAGFDLLIDNSDPDDLEFSLAVSSEPVEKERSNNLDLTYRVQNQNINANFSVFYNQIDNYIFQQNTGLVFHLDEDELEDHQTHEEHEDSHESGSPVYIFSQQDAYIYGFEAELDWHLNDTLRVSAFSDFTRAKLKNSSEQNTNLPRIPPMRFGAELHWEQGDWHAEIGATHYAKQDKIADFETSTAGYTMVSASINYYMSLDSLDLSLYLKANNLTNQLAKVHSSFLKDSAPLPAQAFVFGTKISF
ncbi:TonB-dependent receptor [Paraglaciecola aestuariivivens]